MDKRRRILIADGSEELCANLKGVLEQNGHEVVGTANDGLTAAELLQTAKPDVLITDLMLTQLDGIALLRKAAAMETAPIMMVLTGFMTDFVSATAASLGVRYVIAKPCSAEGVAERLNEVLEAEIFRHRDTKGCARCGRAFVPKSNRAKYCPDCAAHVHRRQKRESERKRRSGVDY